jgi:integrase/recombinase XerD
MHADLIRSWGYSWAAEGRSPRTMTEMRPFLERFATQLGRPLPTATRSDCEQFIASHESPFRANYAWRSLRSFYAWHAEDGGGSSPMAKVKAPKVPLTEVKTTTADDVAKMLRACSPWRTMTRSRDAAIISLLWATGLRRGELAALDVSDVDLDSMTLVVRKSKTGRSRRVPFDARSAQHLSRYLAKRSLSAAAERAPEALWVGRGADGRLSGDGVRQVIERCRKAAGVDVSVHAFRRGLAAHALAGGMSQTSLMAIAGWTSPTMPGRYARGVAAEVAETEYRRLFPR